jgi:virginiamycin A acetyltransferase
LCNKATITPGIKIGHGTIIGTNALVTKDVAPYTIVGGNPGKLIRNRFEQKTIDFLLELAWWDWLIEKITKYVNAIASGNLETLRAL